MGQETQQPSTAALKDNALAQLLVLQGDIAIVNTALTSLGLTNITLSPTIIATQASINAVAV